MQRYLNFMGAASLCERGSERTHAVSGVHVVQETCVSNERDRVHLAYMDRDGPNHFIMSHVSESY